MGKIITIANPLEKGEVQRLMQIHKMNNFFNIIAKFDGIMGHKVPGLTQELSHQIEEVDAGHIGIVFDKQTHQMVVSRLLQAD